MAKSILRAGKIAGVVIVAIILVAVVLYSAGVLSIAQTDYPPPETSGSLQLLPAEPTAVGVDGPAGDATPTEQKKLIIACLLGDAPADAVAAMDTLLTGFFNDPKLADTACALGDAFGREGFYGPALALYRHVADNHGDHPRAIVALRKVVTLHINLNEEDAAQQALDELNL